ncbi:MAG: hypothetical protein A2020_10790 [Lentisphaerae bacterium GWF2_45_14]|nr:MAG: hypothetical protein A2020_10790 [Lentisphaerae bacterium GWF2_45_14]
MALSLTEKQKKGLEILTESGTTKVLFDGGSRSGKTSLLTEYIVMRAFQYPGCRQLIARKFKNHAKQSIWNDTLRKYLTVNIPESLYTKSETELIVNFYNGSSIIIGGLDDDERVEKILGNEYVTILLNEATQLSWESVQMIMTRLAQKVYDTNGEMAVPKLLLDCNPRGPRHWLHMAGVRHIDPFSGKPLPDAAKWARISWSAYDNLSNLPREYIETLESLPENMRDRMLHGIWRGNAGAVYDEFDESTHLVKPFPIPEHWQKFRAIDFGYTNPFVCLWGALDHDNRLYIYRELYKARERTAVHAENIKKLSENEKIRLSVADHDAGERAELESAGINTECALKNIATGIQSVKNRLVIQTDGKPRLFFFSDLPNIISEIYDYSWKSSSDSSCAPEEPVKENDHAMDAMRYMVMAIDRAKSVDTRVASASISDGRYG